MVVQEVEEMNSTQQLSYMGGSPSLSRKLRICAK